jgi:hypothetical protein
MSKPALYLTQQILKTLMRFIGAVMAGVTTGVCVLLASTLFRALPAAATTPAPATINVAVSVAPLVAAPGVARTIKLTLDVASGCIPPSFALDTADTAQTGFVVIRPLFLVEPFCPAPGKFERTFTYTPSAEGVIRVLFPAVTRGASVEARVITAAAGKTRSVVDISGLWYDPASNGSGLTIVHSFNGNDVAFGTWYLYDQAGPARWYSIQNTVWKENGSVLEGDLLESRAGSGCLPPLPCPIASNQVVPVGTVKLSITGDALLGGSSVGVPLSIKVDAFSPTKVPLFSSNIVKIPL